MFKRKTLGKILKVDEAKNTLRLQDQELQEMKDDGMCLSMHQPWASLLVWGIKRIEGRGWPSDHRGRLWIAATVQPPAPEDIEVWGLAGGCRNRGRLRSRVS